MKLIKIISAFLLLAALAVAGWFILNRPDGPDQSTERKVAFYQSPMHPWIKSDEPGNCTICGMKLTPVFEGEAGFNADPSLVALSTNTINVIHVQTEPVQRTPLTRTLNVAGVIDSDETRYRVISAYVDGRIEELFVNYVGAEVEQGEPLATLYSPDLLTAEREFLTVLNQTNLSASPIIAPEHARMVEAARQRLKRLGLRDDQIEQLREKSATNFTTQITAPITGTVITREVYEGQYVKEGDKLFEIADFSTMWFRFDVYEQDLPWIQLGQTVQVTSPALGGKTFAGPITFVEPTINEATRSAKVRVELQNPLIGPESKQRRDLYKNLYAEGRITLRTEPVLAVPRTAVLQPGDHPRVYVDAGGGAYQAIRVKLGRHGEDHWEILGGLRGDEQVVTSGNLLIDSQAQIQSGAAPAHDHGPTLEKPAEDQHSPADHSQHFTLELPQEAAVEKLFDLANQINQAFASDKPDAFQQNAVPLQAAAEQLAQTFASTPLASRAKELLTHAQFGQPATLEAAREAYMPFSNALAQFALELKNLSHRAEPKVFKCPMYPLPGKTAWWVQQGGPIRNPFYGSEMIDCGTEVQ